MSIANVTPESPHYFWRLANASYKSDPESFIQKRFPNVRVLDQTKHSNWLMVLFEDRQTHNKIVAFRGTEKTSLSNWTDHINGHTDGHYSFLVELFNSTLDQWEKDHGKITFFTGHSAGGTYASWSKLDWNHTRRITFNHYDLDVKDQSINCIHLRTSDDPASGSSGFPVAEGGHSIKEFKKGDFFSKNWDEILPNDLSNHFGFGEANITDSSKDLIGASKFYLQKLLRAKRPFFIEPKETYASISQYISNRDQPLHLYSVIGMLGAFIYNPPGKAFWYSAAGFFGLQALSVITRGYGFMDERETYDKSQKFDKSITKIQKENPSITSLFDTRVDELPSSEENLVKTRLFYDFQKDRIEAHQLYQGDSGHFFPIDEKINLNQDELLNCEVLMDPEGKHTFQISDISLVDEEDLQKIPAVEVDPQYDAKVRRMRSQYARRVKGYEALDGATPAGRVVRDSKTGRLEPVEGTALLLPKRFLDSLREKNEVQAGGRWDYEIKYEKSQDRYQILTHYSTPDDKCSISEVLATFDPQSINAFRTLSKEGITEPNFDEFLIQATLPKENLGLPGKGSYSLRKDSRFVAPNEVPFVGLYQLLEKAPEYTLDFQSDLYTYEIDDRIKAFIKHGTFHNSLDSFLKRR